MRGEIGGGPGRTLRADGLTITVPVYIELRAWLNAYFSARGHQRARAGMVVPPGEKKGAAPALALAFAWLASLCDGDIERILAEGGERQARLDALPPDYGKVAGRADPLMIERRTESVFRPMAEDPDDPPSSGRADAENLSLVWLPAADDPDPPSSGRAGAGAGAGDDVTIRLVAVQKYRPPDQPGGGDLIPPGDHAPVAGG